MVSACFLAGEEVDYCCLVVVDFSLAQRTGKRTIDFSSFLVDCCEGEATRKREASDGEVDGELPVRERFLFCIALVREQPVSVDVAFQVSVKGRTVRAFHRGSACRVMDETIGNHIKRRRSSRVVVGSEALCGLREEACVILDEIGKTEAETLVNCFLDDVIQIRFHDVADSFDGLFLELRYYFLCVLRRGDL